MTGFSFFGAPNKLFAVALPVVAGVASITAAHLGKIVDIAPGAGDAQIALPSATTAGEGATLHVRKTDAAAGVVYLNEGVVNRAWLSSINDMVRLRSTGAAWEVIDSTIADFMTTTASFLHRQTVAVSPQDAKAFITFINALPASVEEAVIACGRKKEVALVPVKKAATLALNGSPIWTPYRGFDEAAITDALTITGLSGGTWYERRSDDLYPLGDSEDRLGVAVYGALDAGQEAAFEAAADALLEAFGAKNSSRTIDLACIFGASLEEGNFTQITQSPSTRMVSRDAGNLMWLQAMTGAPFRTPVVYDLSTMLGRAGAIYALGGASLNQFVIWKPAAIASKARYAFVSPSRNGLNAGLEGADIFAGYEEHVNDLRRAGIEMIHIGLSTIASSQGGGWEDGGHSRLQYVVLDGLIRDRAASTGEKYIDVQALMEDPSSPITPKDPDPTKVGPDGQHLITKGGYAHGADPAAQAVIATAFGSWPAIDFTGNKFAQRLTAYSSGGTLSNGATGVAPAGMMLNREAGGASNISVSGGFVKPDGMGGWTPTTNPADTDAWYEITVTSAGVPGAAIERTELRQDWASSGSGTPINTRFGFSCDIDVGAESDLLRAVETYTRSTGTGENAYYMLLNGTATTAATKGLQPKNYRRRDVGIFRLISTTSLTRSHIFMFINPTIAGTVKLRSRNWKLAVITDPYLEFPVNP